MHSIEMKWSFELRNCRGYRYLYIVQKAWTKKGPRNVRQIYIGTANTLHKRLHARPGSLSLRTFPFGKNAAYLHAAHETGFLRALEDNLPLKGKAARAAAQLIFLQVLGRAERPQSRRRMGHRWYPSSGLPLYWPVPAATDRAMLATLRLLFGTDRENNAGEMVLTRARVRKVEEQVLRTLLAKGLDLRYLLFDGTNFFTYHRGIRGKLHEPGRSKDRRYDKRLMGLGLATAGEIPVLSEVVPGNMGDVDVFAEAFEALVKRLEHLEVATEKLTIVFDRGVNSTENFEEVIGVMHVIAALDRPQAKRLYEVPLTKFREVARDGKLRPILGYASEWTGFERDWRALVTYREATAEKEQGDWEEARAKVLRKVAKLRRKAPRKKEKVVVNDLADTIPRNYRGMFSYGVETLEVVRKGKKVKRYQPRCEVDAAKEAELRASFGKTVVITDLSEKEAPDGELVRGWVLRTDIEEEFKWLKDRYVISMKPVWVWHEAAVPGHAFLVVMGLMLLRYLLWEAKDLGLTVKELVETLEGIRVGVVSREGKPGGKGAPEVILESMTKRQAELATKFHLTEMLPVLNDTAA